MAQPILWSKKPSFHPFASSPPVCFTQDLAPEEDAQVLLLGCGDPRSILYTIDANLGTYERKLDFTCCDLEPAILARNIILLTMVANDVSTTNIWRIFFHFFLDDGALQVLIAQCRKLIQTSSDIDTWNGSKYGSFLRFCTKHTLMEIKRQWQLYVDMDLLPEADKRALKTDFTSNMQKIQQRNRGISALAKRASGFLGTTHAIAATQHSFTSLWTNGVIKRANTATPPTPHINPTFVYSRAGSTFNVHVTSDPLAGFHLAPALTEIKDGPSAPKIGAEPFYAQVVDQFSVWCSSFKERIKNSSTFMLRFFAGDALAFCQALRVCKTEGIVTTGIYTTPWGISQIDLCITDYSVAHSASSGPLLFNVIDTSNVKDHLGLLNVLLVTVPLLQRKPWSAIHTCTVVERNPSTAPIISSLEYRAFADIPTLSIFLGVAPSSHLYHFATRSDKHEILASIDFNGLLESIIWKFPSAVVTSVNANDSSLPYPEHDELPPVLVCDATLLGRFLFSFYMKMFEEEALKPMKYEMGYRMNIILYTRASFATFVAFVKERTEVDWDEAIRVFFGCLKSERTFVAGRQYYQELACQLYLRGLCSRDALRWNFVKEVRFVDEDRGPNDFPGWKEVPPVVCVILKVPRHHLRTLEDMDISLRPIPMLQCETKGAKGAPCHYHPAIRPTFGDIVVSRVDGEPHVVVNEDLLGWRGKSDLIVTFDAPSWIFSQRGEYSRISLHLRATPATVKDINDKLPLKKGMLFETSLADEEHVHVVRHRLNETRDICSSNDTSTTSGAELALATDRVSVVFDESGTKATSLVFQDVIQDAKDAKTLARGAKVSAEPVADTAILVSYHGYERLFKFPYPVKSAICKPKIERMSTPPYIEIECPIRRNFIDFTDLSLNLYPFARGETTPNLLNIHYVKLEVSPALQLPMPTSSLQWFAHLVALSFSTQEMKLQNSIQVQAKRHMIINLKETIATFFMKWSGLETPHARLNAFSLNHPISGAHTLIFVNDIRLDLPSHSVIVDACVVPLSERNALNVRAIMQRNAGKGLTETKTLDDEMNTWRHLLPAYAERCRTWRHTSECEYTEHGIPSHGNDARHSPLCSCGKGEDLGDFANQYDWRGLQQEATRVAICPLYSFTFMENVVEAASQPQPLSNRCSHCAGPGKPTLMKCGSCKREQYCSQQCQRLHWKAHKPTCRTR